MIIHSCLFRLLTKFYNFVNNLFSFKVYIKCGIIKYIKDKGSWKMKVLVINTPIYNRKVADKEDFLPPLGLRIYCNIPNKSRGRCKDS